MTISANILRLGLYLGAVALLIALEHRYLYLKYKDKEYLRRGMGILTVFTPAGGLAPYFSGLQLWLALGIGFGIAGLIKISLDSRLNKSPFAVLRDKLDKWGPE